MSIWLAETLHHDAVNPLPADASTAPRGFPNSLPDTAFRRGSPSTRAMRTTSRTRPAAPRCARTERRAALRHSRCPSRLADLTAGRRDTLCVKQTRYLCRDVEGARKVGPADLRAREVCASQFGPSEVGTTAVRRLEDRAFQV